MLLLNHCHAGTKRGAEILFCLFVSLTVFGCGNSVTESNDTAGSQAENPEQPSQAAAKNSNSTEQTSAFHFVKPALSEEQLKAGWISLFDGSSLFGWDVPDASNWHMEDSSIVADSGERSLLLTPFRFDDFEMLCDFHLEPGGNSGIFLRTAENLHDPATDTYELNICDNHPTHATGSFVGRHVTDGVPPVEGEWHTFRILCEGERIQVWLDDNPIVDFTDTSEAKLLTGRIGLQMNTGRIAFRNVFLRPVSSRPLFNGQDLSGWRVVPGSKSEFSVVDHSIHVSNGPGFLETEETFGDFVLHLEARTNGVGLNSGVFFRAMQGTEQAPSHGYEMQIQHAFRNNDRTQPEDFGTGAIFRRIPARYIVGNDHEWVTQTLIAQENRFATWVNGYQVVNWQDERKPDSNPRQGQRLEPGHISLQGHDPTTDLDFRTIRIHTLR